MWLELGLLLSQAGVFAQAYEEVEPTTQFEYLQTKRPPRFLSPLLPISNIIMTKQILEQITTWVGGEDSSGQTLNYNYKHLWKESYGLNWRPCHVDFNNHN